MHTVSLRHVVPLRHAALLGLLLLPASAFAHTGAGEHNHFFSGFLHPLGGLDHLLAMFAVGLWSMQLRPQRAQWIPLAFVTVMTTGFSAALHGLQLPFMESGIAFSVLLLGLLIASAARMPVAIGAVLAGGFALFHGVAHGMEMDSDASARLFGSGFVLATALLHSAGLLCGFMLRHGQQDALTRVVGSGIAAAGLWLVLG